MASLLLAHGATSTFHLLQVVVTMKHMHLVFLLSFGCSEHSLISKETPEQDNQQPEDQAEVSAEPEVEPQNCDTPEIDPEEIGIGDICPTEPSGGFSPVVEWSYGSNQGCLALPIVVDLNGDGTPEVLLNLTDLFMSPGQLVALNGDGSGVLWSQPNANLGYGSPVAVGDIDNNGYPEIIGVREYASSLFAEGDYTIVAFNSQGNQIWESAHFSGQDFDYATAPSIADMNGDGSPEIVAGRVILNADGTTRGVGQHGRGSYGISSFGSFSVSESAVSAVTDLDLDGQQEVIAGNAWYDIDGNAIWYDPGQDDAMISIANLDSDPEGEVIGISYNTIRAIDTDGSILWGPVTIASANILSTAAVADVDGDGQVEIITAGGNELYCLNHDGTVLWTAAVTDESGATGASIFDFEGDGVPEVVYIDEQQMVAYDGLNGAVKFYSADHASNTMFDYPVIVDVDADDNAEILVCHNGYSHAFSVYGDANNSWVAARDLWNQHAYSINNINDDYSIPTSPMPSFQDTNTWHSAISSPSVSGRMNIEPELIDVCLDDCDQGVVWVTIRIYNSGEDALQQDVLLSIYGRTGSVESLIQTETLALQLDAGWTTQSITLALDSSVVEDLSMLRFQLDDDGTGTGVLEECSELDNELQIIGPFCQ